MYLYRGLYHFFIMTILSVSFVYASGELLLQTSPNPFKKATTPGKRQTEAKFVQEELPSREDKENISPTPTPATESLKLIGPISEENLAKLKQYKEIYFVGVYFRRYYLLDDISSKQFNPKLESLTLHGCRLDDSDLQNIATLKHLKELVIIGNDIRDEGVEHIMKLDHLTCLSMVSTHITNEGFKRLLTIPTLRQLSVKRNKKITDEVVNDILSGNHHLTHLDVFLTGMSLKNQFKIKDTYPKPTFLKKKK